MTLLCLHGVGHQQLIPAFKDRWREAILQGLAGLTLDGENVAANVQIEFFEYGGVFAKQPADFNTWSRAFQSLLRSGLRSALERRQPPPGTRGAPAARGIRDWFEAGRETLQWTAGMVAKWAADPKLRADLRRALTGALRDHRPDALIAHSLGSLIAYDLLARPATAALGTDRVLVTLGSQINNPFVRDLLGGRLHGLETRHWFHLYNRHDDAFTAPIAAPLPRFTQVDTDFNLPGFLDHDAIEYLRHDRARRAIWSYLSQQAEPPAVRAARDLPASPARVRSLGDAIAFSIGEARSKPAKRALLVGINAYPDPRLALEGCVNDVYLMSEVLQEQGFAAENIRIVLDDRATAAGIRERVDWLLEDCQNGFDRVLYYSGHGAQIASYGVGETVDALDECLVPWDFDWTPERALLDDWFHEAYSQLPPEARFLAVFDCCHSGGLARDGGPRVRGIDPPDDIRHRLLRWDEEAEVWRDRALEVEKSPASRATARASAAGLRVGRMATTAGSPAARAFAPDPSAFGLRDAAYMPIILQACQEGQKAFEYRHGSTPHGAFTFSLVRALRRRAGRRYSWGDLLKDVAEQIRRLGYRDQNPGHEGPAGFELDVIPWMPKPSRRR